jgi:hypothetical protein
MTENIAPKGKPGRPKKEKPPVDWQSKAKKWDDIEFSDGLENRFEIDPEILAAVHADGCDLEWIRASCLGKPDPESLSVAAQNHWEPVEAGKWGINVVEIGGLVLMERPRKVSEKFREYEQRKSVAPITNMRRKHGEGDLPVTLDSRHPSAKRSNKHASTYERLEIPGDE